ncbi:MAG TPA: hypothetical protein VEA37_12705 [Flavobacterium sp.]|nr:hypothetical protein [Flavobacterium sp.]
MEIKKRDTQIDKEDAELLKWVEANMDKYMKIWRKCVSLNIEFIKRGMEDRVRIPPMRHHLDTGLD